MYFQIFSFPQLEATRAISGRSVPVIACLAAGAGALIRLFGPESMGGRGDFRAKVDAEVALTGLSEDEISRKVNILYYASRLTKRHLYSKIMRHTEGKLIRIPGLPVMYDHEFFPQKVCWPI